jgi:NTP pyrophosphatase (non-canonical NTP hydrolase)
MTQPSESDLSIRELQATVDAWIRDVGVRYFSEMTNLAILMEEVGELARIFARSFGDQSFKNDEASYNLSDELADILFVVVCLANQTGVDLQTAIEANLAKKSQRDAQRHRNNPKLQPPDSSLSNSSQRDEIPRTINQSKEPEL